MTPNHKFSHAADGLYSVGRSVVPVCASSVLVLVALAGVPAPWSATAALGWVTALLALWLGVGEWLVIVLRWRARPLRAREKSAIAPILDDLHSRGLNVGVCKLVVSSHLGGRLAVASGRRHILIDSGLVAAITDRRVRFDAAEAVVGYAALMIRGGVVKHDPALMTWAAPWILAGRVVPRPRHGLFLTAWRGRPIVGMIAVVEALSIDELVPYRILAAGGVATVLALTYLHPYWTRVWSRRVATKIDAEIAELGLGPAYCAAVLFGEPDTLDVLARREVLQTPPATTNRPHLRLVRAEAQ